MCGVFGVKKNQSFYKNFEVSNPQETIWRDSYNVRPTQQAPILTKNSPLTVQLASFGLLPFWAKDAKIAYSTFNARSEDIDVKSTWKESYQTRRCIVPVSYYAEFAHAKDDPKTKIPYLFKHKKDDYLALAGIYRDWENKTTNETIRTFAIITTTANKIGAQVHSRMPVILQKKDYDTWTDNAHFDPIVMKSLLKPYSDSEIESWPVNREINNSRNNYPELTDKVEEVPIKPSKPSWEEKKSKS